MNLGEIQTALTTWTETYLDLKTDWELQAESAYYRLEARALLSITSSSKVFVDEPLWVYNELTDENEAFMTGIRNLTFTITVRNNDQRQEFTARQYLETFRTRTLSPSSIAFLSENCLALVETLPLVNLDYRRDDRRESQTSMDILFQLRSTEQDEQFGGEYIKTVDIDFERYVQAEDGTFVRDEDGNLITTDATDFIEVTSD